MIKAEPPVQAVPGSGRWLLEGESGHRFVADAPFTPGIPERVGRGAIKVLRQLDDDEDAATVAAEAGATAKRPAPPEETPETPKRGRARGEG